jgi:hypothetical protein
MIFFYCTDGELGQGGQTTGRSEAERIPTISVASTRVPTIFSRTRVPLSMIYNHEIGGLVRDNSRHTWSTEANEVGFELGSNFISGWISFRERKFRCS